METSHNRHLTEKDSDPAMKAKLAAEKAEFLDKRLQECDLCPRDCHVDRSAGQTGHCGAGEELVVYTAFIHHGEEPGIRGVGGSGTIFFSGCNLKCVYCQNHRFSHSLEGSRITSQDLAKIMLRLQEKGAENINLVTPTHFLPQILAALSIAIQHGLRLPLVYNTSGYEKEETIEMLDGIVDVYLADMRYITPSLAERYSNAPNYPSVSQRSLQKMYKQKQNIWEGETLKEGLVVRHLVLPGHSEESSKVLSWINKNIPGAIISLMFQYQPYFKAHLYPEIDRRVNKAEYDKTRDFLKGLELEGWVQELSAGDELAGVHFKPSLEGLL
jgi:putative pyruvate formate lyase activating enzyme